MSHRIARTAGLLLLKAVFLALTVYSQGPANAKANIAKAGRGVVVVELFTSEGCSSCPPADALLRQIDGTRTKAGQLIIGISEHVTYWNHLGWADPFSAETYTQRQDGYARRFHLDSVYTPQMVINGDEQIVGSDRTALERLLSRESIPLPITIQINTVTARGDVLTVDYSVTGNIPAGGADMFAIVADDAVRSSVLRGENSGRVLTHVSVARVIMRVKTTSSSNSQTLEIPLPRAGSSLQKPNRHLILIAQGAGLGSVLGADEKSF